MVVFVETVLSAPVVLQIVVKVSLNYFQSGRRNTGCPRAPLEGDIEGEIIVNIDDLGKNCGGCGVCLAHPERKCWSSQGQDDQPELRRITLLSFMRQCAIRFVTGKRLISRCYT